MVVDFVAESIGSRQETQTGKSIENAFAGSYNGRLRDEGLNTN